MESDALEPEALSMTEKHISLLFLFGWSTNLKELQLSIEGSSEKIKCGSNVLEATTLQFIVELWQS